MKTTNDMRRRAVELWRGNRQLARKWLRAVDVVRKTKGGWVLENGTPWRERGRV